jgi:hypothetical protein
MAGTYPLKCRKCGKSFAVSFVTKNKEKKEKNEVPHQKKVLAFGVDDHYHQAKPQQNHRENASHEERFNDTHREETYFSVDVIKNYVLSIFHLKKIAISFAGVFTLFVLLSLMSWFESFLEKLEFIRLNLYFLHLLNFFEIFCFAAGIASIHSVIAYQTEAQGKGRILSFSEIAVFALSRSLPLLALSFGIILLFNGLMVLFGSIPFIGPVLYALLFLPVYVLSIALVLFGSVAFWFYPPLLACSNESRSSIIEFINFMQRHKTSLLPFLLLVIVLASVFAGLLLMLHGIGISIAISFSKSILGDEFFRMVSGVSLNVGDALNFRGFFSRFLILHHLMKDLLLGYRLGGMILGFVLFLLSGAVYSIILSGTGTISAWAFRAIESEERAYAKKVKNILITLMLLLAVMYLFKKVFL